MKAVVVGGGVGGLTAALCLEATGWDVVVLERAREITEVGAGIQISANGSKVLHALGVLPAVQALAFRPQGIEMRLGRSGRRIFSFPLAGVSVARWGAPYLHLHRADLIGALQHRLIGRAPDALRLNTHVTGYEQTSHTIAARLDDGSRVEADVLIGADGIHSVIRAQMLGAEAPRFTGSVAWRAVVPMDRLGEHLPPPTACIWAGPGRHAVTYRLRGGAIANFVGIVEQDGWEKESWSEQGRREEALADFAGWHPVVRTIIEQADSHYRWALFDRAPLRQWSDGRAVLLGDACHPMLPTLAQGAVMAIEDAWVLADMLKQNANIPRALGDYFTARRDRTARVQATSKRNLRLFHQRSAAAQVIAYGPIRMAAAMAPRLFHWRHDWLYGHDVTG